jgi:exonuclease SbcC
MIFKRLLGRKKRPALSPADQEDLIRILREDQDAGIRRDVCRRIKTLGVLRDLGASDPDAGVREVALAHYRKLLCASENQDAPALLDRLAEVSVLEDQEILEQVALEGAEAELRRAAIAKISSQDVLASCALNDQLAANRQAAVELLDDKRALIQVVRNIGKKDTHVYRVARRRLKEITEREALPERIRVQCEELCEKLERLGRFGNWVQDRALLDLLDRQWGEIAREADEERKARYEDLRGRFLRAYEEHRSAHEAQIAAEDARDALRAKLQALLGDLRALSARVEQAEVANGLERITARWDELTSLAEKEQAYLAKEYAAAREAASGHLEALRAGSRRDSRLQRLLHRAENALEAAKPLDQKQIRGLIEEAERLLDAKGVDKAVRARFGELRKALEGRLRKQKTQAEKRLGLLPERLDKFASALEQGILKEAEPLYQSIVAGLTLIELSGAPRSAYGEAATRLRALTPRLRDLQKWRKWGTDQHREELCVAMEALSSDDIRLDAMALRLQDLQMEWKELDKGGSPINQLLWERFHAASERVYECCKPYLDEQTAQLQANRQQRERLCGELEAFLDQVDWERMDWRKAVRADREMRQAWSDMGPVEGRYRKSLEKRFRRALKRLDAYLTEERDRNQAYKRELIAQVEALAQEADLGRAIEAAKRLQRHWQTTVPGRQREENRLWQRFRGACDEVFARRREQREAQDAELSENLRRREDLCAEAERLADSDSHPKELAAALQELSGRWADSDTLAVPPQTAVGLSQRWRAARRLVEDRRRERLEEQRRRDLTLLAQKAALCERLERALESGLDPERATLEADWRSLPDQSDPELQAAMEKRFHRALEALEQGGEKLEALRKAFVVDGERRAELCLHLEILGRVDSPPELTEERLRFQVMRLTEHMREGEKDPLEASFRLLQQWYLCGPAPLSVAAGLEERFSRARRAIEAAEPSHEAA